MAGTKITLEANGATSWSDFVTITGHARRHFQFVSFTNTTSTGAPAVEEGSYAVVNGTMYCLTPSTGGNETISTTGLSTGFTDGELWVKVVPTTGTAITAEYTTDAPTWSASKGGYYSTGNDRYLGGVYKSTGEYGEKWVYEEGKKLSGGETRPRLTKKLNIGSLDITATKLKNVSHGITRWKTIQASAVIYDDLDSQVFKIERYDNAADPNLVSAGISAIDNTNVAIEFRTGGRFDDAAFNDTSIDRGTIYCGYEG